MTNVDIIKSLQNSKSVCIIGHIDPDADALASMTVLKDFLINYYNIPIVDLYGQTDEIQENCKFMLDGHIINSSVKEYDSAIVVDSPSLERIGDYSELFKEAKSTYSIDHHDTNTFFADFNIIEKAASTSEIIFKLLENFNYHFTEQNYKNIYSGIITDTNNFTTPNLTQTTFEVVSKIINKINFIEIYNNFFSNYSINSAKLYSFALKNLVSLKNNKILISFLNKKHFKKSNSTINNTTGIINKIATISGNILTCLIYPKEKEFYVSLRAKNGYNVANIAKKFGGGGHVGAAGFLTKIIPKKIVKIIKNEFLNII